MLLCLPFVPCNVRYLLLVKGFAYIKGTWGICKQHPRFLPRFAGFPREPETFVLWQVSCQICLCRNELLSGNVSGQRLSKALRNCIGIFPQSKVAIVLPRLTMRRGLRKSITTKHKIFRGYVFGKVLHKCRLGGYPSTLGILLYWT